LGWVDVARGVYFRKRWRGFITLSRLLGRRPEETIRASAKTGLVLDLSPFSYIDSVVLREGYYEFEVLDAILDNLGSNPVFWDIGANLGLHGLSVKKMRPEVEVVCFDPSPGVIGKLWTHRQLNSLDVQVICTALSDRTGFSSLHVASEGNPGMSTIEPWSGGQYAGQVLIGTVRGDDLVAQKLVTAPTVIKIDVEGHEASVLRGLQSVLARSCKVVIFEDSPDAKTESKTLLTDLGFQFRSLHRLEATAHALSNILAYRQD